MTRRGLRALLTPLARPHTRAISIGVTATVLQTAAALGIPYLVKIGIDNGVLAGDMAVLTKAAAGCLLLAALEVMFARIQIGAVAAAGHGLLYAVRVALFTHLQRLSLQFYENNRTGRIVASITADIDAMTAFVTQGLATLAASSLTLVGTAVVLVVLDPGLAIASLVVAPVLAACTVWFRRRSAVVWRQVRERATAVTIQLQQTLTAIPVIQSFRHEGATLAHLRDVNANEQEAKRSTVRIAAAYFPTVDLCAALASAAVLAAGSLRLASGGLEIGTLAAFLLYLRGFFSPVYELSNVYDSVQAATAGAERITEIMATNPTVAEAEQPVHLARVEGTIVLRDVRFRYPDPTNGVGPEVLNGISLTVPAGTTLALIGPSGAGKSTLAKLILRFYDPASGAVTLDGVDLRDLAMTDLRRAIAYVPQDGFLFAGTILDNIRYGSPQASRAEVEAAAEALGVWPPLAAAPLGLDSQVGERGKLLSASQRQIIAILRAWLAEPAILIWDEATSSLDAETDQVVQKATRVLREGRTTIVITHRLGHAMEADAVAMIHDGVVAAYGPPADVLNGATWHPATAG